MRHPHHALLSAIIEKRFSISSGRLYKDANLRKDLNLDSLDLGDLALEIEIAFDEQHNIEVMLSETELAAIKTYGQLLEALPKLEGK